MLAQNFKTPTDLGISDAEFTALLKVLHGLETNKLLEIPAEQAFYMPAVIKLDCGTRGCILGWAYLLSNGAAFDSPQMREAEAGGKPSWTGFTHLPNLDELFFPDCYNANFRCDHVTPGRAAIALRNYLTHGEPRWAEALAE